MLAVRGGTIGCAWWHYYLCVVALLSVRGGTIICAWWHYEGRSRCLSVLLSPRPGSELCPLFLRPGGGHKGKRNKELCSLFLRPGGGHKGERNNDGAGGVEKGSKGLTLVNF